MLHIDYKKWQCRPVDFKIGPCPPVEFVKLCGCCCVALSILEVYTLTCIFCTLHINYLLQLFELGSSVCIYMPLKGTTVPYCLLALCALSCDRP